ncbi:hypothetical protein G9A89_016950 [Geosiphon pyriformis]|nr:hypothetical protein G9A89_016950 [Geosiphon pyriformis]
MAKSGSKIDETLKNGSGKDQKTNKEETAKEFILIDPNDPTNSVRKAILLVEKETPTTVHKTGNKEQKPAEERTDSTAVPKTDKEKKPAEERSHSTAVPKTDKGKKPAEERSHSTAVPKTDKEKKPAEAPSHSENPRTNNNPPSKQPKSDHQESKEHDPKGSNEDLSMTQKQTHSQTTAEGKKNDTSDIHSVPLGPTVLPPVVPPVFVPQSQQTVETPISILDNNRIATQTLPLGVNNQSAVPIPGSFQTSSNDAVLDNHIMNPTENVNVQQDLRYVLAMNESLVPWENVPFSPLIPAPIVHNEPISPLISVPIKEIAHEEPMEIESIE